ncbi:hypothetical protein E2C01_062939 [Portunus trituberculatus]|uniref:Uncharacterized protein n=1 Tax=Portunus trituberculatus TaxID=210409 RepID=A0A5B7HCG3_PORTR|nr:hypothetical protein [Portunus trituberculatus]
MGIFPLYLQMT